MWVNTAQGNFGIILAEDETTGERKLYAGVAAGFDQQADEQAILSWGNKVNLGMLGGLLARAGKPKEKVKIRVTKLIPGGQRLDINIEGQITHQAGHDEAIVQMLLEAEQHGNDGAARIHIQKGSV